MRFTQWILLIILCSLVAGCQKEPAANPPAPNPEPSVTIQSVDLIEGTVASAGTSLRRLEEWKAPNNSAKLPVFDVVMKFQNPGASTLQDGDLIILTTIDFVIAPTYLHDGDVHKILDSLNWARQSNVDDVKMQAVPFMRSGDVAEVRITGFDLSDLFTFYNGEDDTLWPWGLRVNVHLMNREMNRVALGQATLRIIPADTRLAQK
jgi:hypothetical protein